MGDVKIIAAAEKLDEHKIRLTLDIDNLNGVDTIISGFEAVKAFSKGMIMTGCVSFCEFALEIYSAIKKGKKS